MRHQIESIAIAGTERTIGSEKALTALEERGGSLHVELTFGFPAQFLADELQRQIAAATGKDVQLILRQNIVAHKVQAGIHTIKGVKNIIAVASGKGGVGKSTTTANLATAMAAMGARVGVLDADLYGPSQPTMLGVPESKPQQENKHFIPVRSAEGIQVMSIGFLVDTDQAVVWRGPMVSQALQQLRFAERSGSGGRTEQNALFLLMQSHEKLRNCESVILTGQRFATRFATNPKAAEALYSVGNCQWGMQQRDIARATWRKLMQTYPNSPAARRASQRI